MRSSPHRLQAALVLEDGHSMVSASSHSSSTLIDIASQRSNATVNASQSQQQYRKFTSAVGKPGQARETREAVSKALNATNPVRVSPISTPMDYEKFVVEKSAQLEHDRDRDLLLFLRDDISESFSQPQERTAVPSVSSTHLKEAQWLLTLDALKHYSSPHSIITFNYAKFSGDFRKFDAVQGLSYLKFESDMAMDEEKMLSNGQQPSDVIKEGYLVVVPGESSFVDNFRSEKKRYCVVKRDEEGRVLIEILKQPNQPNAGQTQAPLEIKTAVLKTTKKGKTVLQISVSPEADKSTLILAAEADSELQMWQMDIDRALKWNCKEDSISLGSSSRANSIQPNSTTAADAESVTSEESYTSYRDANMGMVWRGRNAAAKALQPPIVDRRNLFSLYWDLEPLKEAEGTASCLLHPPHQPKPCSSSAIAMQRASRSISSVDSPSIHRKYSPVTSGSTFECHPQSRSTSGVESSDAARDECSSPTPSGSSFLAEKPGILFVAELQQLNIKLSLGTAAPIQIEPFFVRMFLFDAGLGVRISEEFHMNVMPNENMAGSLPSSSTATSSTYSSSGVFEENAAGKTVRSPKINGVKRSTLLNPNANKLICPIRNPRTDIFLIAKVERLLSDSSADIYSKSSGIADSKAAAKLLKSIKTASQKLAQYRSSFGWAVSPVFPSMCNTSSTQPNKALQLYKCEARLTDGDLQKYLNEFAKLEKSGKLVPVPGAMLTVGVEITPSVADLPMRVSPSLLPLRPWRAPGDSPLAPAFELQSFVSEALVAEPYKSCVNILYVYPISLNYGSQKAFSRARNIACTVSFMAGNGRRDSDGHLKPAAFIVDRTDSQQGPIVSSKTCTVQYHEQNPQFDDEIKVQLPCFLDNTDHLLFTFKHISVANALSPKASCNEQPFESPIGYAWLPLVRESNDTFKYLIMSEDSEFFDLPVAVNLPPGYVKSQMSQQVSPDLKFVENGRPLFRVRLRLISSVFSTDEHVQSFFQCCQNIEATCQTISPCDEEHKSNNNNRKFSPSMFSHHNRSCSPYVESRIDEASVDNARTGSEFKRVIDKIKALACVDIYHLIPFLHIIINRLLTLLVSSPSDEVSLNTLNVLVVIVDRVAENKSTQEILRDFVYYHLRYIVSVDSEESTHSSLVKYLPMLIRTVQGDNKAVGSIFHQLWFFVDCTVKCMAQWLIRNKMFKTPRRDRFPTEVLYRIEGFVQFLISQIIYKHKDLPVECRQANLSLANLLKYCLSLTDRYAIMNQVHYVVEKLDQNSSRSLRVFKLELLQVLCGHEHWLPLCLPLLTDKNGCVMRGDSSTVFEPAPKPSSGGLIAKFFAQIFSTTTAILESTEADRYANYVEHFYLSTVYCQTHFLSGIVFQELAAALRDPREYRRQVIQLVRNLLAKHSADTRYTDSSAQNRIAVLYTPIIRLVIENIRELEATAKVSAESPNLSPTSNTNNTTLNQLKSRSLTADWRSTNPLLSSDNSSLVSSSLGTAKNLRSSTTTTTKAATLPSAADTTHGPNQNPASIATFSEKLDKTEARDLILCVLYVLNKLPKKTVGALWCSQENMKSSEQACPGPANTSQSASTSSTNVYLDFIRVLELALFMFRYRGRSYHVREQAKRQRSSMKTLVNFQTNERSCTIDSHLSSSTATTTAPYNALNVDEEAVGDSSTIATSSMSFLQDCHLTQEVALIVLEVCQTLANQIATRAKQLNSETIEMAFKRLLDVEIQLLSPSWPENVRLHALAGLAVFINLFSARFFQSGPLECLSCLIKALLLQLNCRFVRVQTAAAALLQLVLRNGFDVASAHYSKHLDSSPLSTDNTKPALATERLGRPGSQTGVALADLLSHKPVLLTPGSARFERGLSALESLVQNYGEKRVSMFEKGVLELIKQLRGVLDATSAVHEADNDPIRSADLHIQLANSYRGSAALRSAWFDALARRHSNERWYSEAAVCQAHSIAIIGKELVAKGLAKIDWSLLDMINDKIAVEENVSEDQMDSTQQAGYTAENFTEKVEKTIDTLILSERYEAVGPLCRLAIPIYEQRHDYKALVSLYAELQQANSRAAEVKASGKRHLGSYFRVVFLGEAHFGGEHKTEWIYRELRLTSLAEACDRMVEAVRNALGKDQVEILPPEKEGVDMSRLKSSVAYIQVGHVEPCSAKMLKTGGDPAKLAANETAEKGEEEDDPMFYKLHTNVSTFVYEERITDESVPSSAPEQAKLAVKRIVLTVEKSFPNTRRRQKVVDKTEFILNPLELACDSLLFKAAQIRRILNAAGILRGAYGFDKSALRRLDVKQLQLFLQGSVSPTVNAGVLAYAEAFTAPAQKERYGSAGTAKLVAAFKVLMTELAEALKINEAAMGSERTEYQSMLRNSFDGMLERLSVFFDGEKFIMEPFSKNVVNTEDISGPDGNSSLNTNRSSSTAMHIFDSIGGVNA